MVFFVTESLESENISNKRSEFYAPKLAAAIRAWSEVTTDPEALKGKTPKKALEVWLRKHANEYGLSNDDGLPNKLGIEEVCKVANWKPGGGASPTPNQAATADTPQASPAGRIVKPRPPTPSKNRRPLANRPAPMDEDVPF